MQQITRWYKIGFTKIGVPPVLIHFIWGIFYCERSSYWGTHHLLGNLGIHLDHHWFISLLTNLVDVKTWKGTHQVKSILKLSDPHIWQESMSEYDPFSKLVYTDWSLTVQQLWFFVWALNSQPNPTTPGPLFVFSKYSIMFHVSSINCRYRDSCKCSLKSIYW